MFFKDLTRVEQLEERERLRDRLAAVGEMAAAIAHEVKNPLAGIEVMAGLLRRKITDSPEAQTLLTDIINEAKMANEIVQEVLEFVRPIRLQVERTRVADAVQAAVQLADTKVRAAKSTWMSGSRDGLPLIQGDQHQLTQLFTNLLTNAYEAMEGQGRVTITACHDAHGWTAPTDAKRCSSSWPTKGRGCRRRWPTGCSTRSSRRSRRARGSGSPSFGRSWTRTTGASISDRARARDDDSGDAAGDGRRLTN